ncbi:MAG: FtsX-like permease family protein [Caldilineaceae bacterium]
MSFPPRPKIVPGGQSELSASADRQRHGGHLLVRAAGDPAQLAATLRTQLADPMLKIESLNEVTAQLTSTLTTLSLDALTRIEWGYTVLIAVVALIIFLLSLLAERRTEYATLAALGATPGQRNSFLYLEAGISGVAGLAIGAIVGTTLTQYS